MDQGLGQAMTARAEKKRAQILDGARAVFLAEGFDGASMEAIAHAAGVSKGTLYTYFKGKDELFTALVAACQNRSLEETFRSLNKASDPRGNLETLARNYLDRVREPENLALLRVVVGASAKFPSLGQAFYETGMRPPVERLAQYLKDNASPRAASAWDVELAAVQFFAFLRASVAIPMLIAHEPFPSPRRCSAIVAQAVGTLLRDLGEQPASAEA
ncbi:TetR/AcrR family transcriptional regulator [Microvirga sp. CF3016]|uniref:TetR/AcrR family transcriptional regulator n=1 Tax=Microvirga sp. CF3016 TaxID=3110181 RepID=UPI002E79977C|nr:TetR/AcrR family transcriptional regulator [Microvirga sp. CF3016]MEE1613463.1 TetR/AcrR family transcriptional regulator [Microvirga sp. CF3016]